MTEMKNMTNEEVLKFIHDRCEEVGECWIWKRSLNSTGYPIIRLPDGQSCVLVRRLVYAASHDGVMPDARKRGMVVRCGERLCCSPKHIMSATRSRIVASGYANDRRNTTHEYWARAQNNIANGQAKLNWQIAQDIRADKRPHKAVAEHYGVSHSLVAKIRQNQIWKAAHEASSIFTLGRRMAPDIQVRGR